MVNLNIGIPQNDNIEWLKFAINNKIIYTPKKPIRYNLSWSDLYNLNLIDGSKLLVINGDEYYIRLFKG
jgi:hypothetical protein